MKHLNILIIDDEPEISEIIGLILSTEYILECTHAESGNAGIKFISESPQKYDLVICDFKMPNGNGKAVFTYISDHNNGNTGYLEKPFSENSLFSVVSKVLTETTTSDTDQTTANYIPVTINTLLKIHKINCPLYLILNDNKYVKLFNENSIFDKAAHDKYKQKNVNCLYVLKNQFNNLIMDFKQNVLSDLLFSTYKPEANEPFELSASTQEIINSSIRSFGFSQQSVEMTQANIKLVKTIVDKTPPLQTVLRWLENSDFKHELIHSLLLTYFIGAIAQNYKFKSPYSVEFLTIAAFFHDIALEAYQIENEPKFKEAIRHNILINKTDIDLIKKHPQKSVEILSKWKLCPKEVLQIIENHCERPDGKGFNNGLNANELDELSACFIFSEDIVTQFLNLKNKTSLLNYLEKNMQYYSTAYFKDFFKITKDLLNETQPSKQTA
jgi:HD-GYP domain-containing protein (c-di-GMP phosphodiesterase class II)